MKKRTPEELQREEIEERIRGVLGDEYDTFSLQNLLIDEMVGEEKTKIECTITTAHRDIIFEAVGDGMVDALYKGFIGELSGSYKCLSDILVEDFAITADTSRRKKPSGSDSVAVASLSVNNSQARTVRFSAESRSMIHASANVVLSTVEYYVNCEKAVRKVYKILEELRKNEPMRTDLIDKYILIMSDLVRSTSYEKTIMNLKDFKV